MYTLSVLLLLLLVVATFATSVAATTQQQQQQHPTVNVFTMTEAKAAGYFCIKIPYIVSTASGALIALGEARYGSCSDFTATDLVMKRSDDGGNTWGPLTLFYGNSSKADNITHVVGNANPVQLASGRLLIPFCVDNMLVYQLWSDDDGKTWLPSPKSPAFVPSIYDPAKWHWVGLGPPAAIQLQHSNGGRIVAPIYLCTDPHWMDGTICRVHLLLNDDAVGGSPNRWRLGARANKVPWTSESQAAEIAPGVIFVGSRAELWQRVGLVSRDAGETFASENYINITQPLGGCEGSTVFHSKSSMLLYSGTTNTNPARYNMTLWGSLVVNPRTGGGGGQMGPWRMLKVIDPNRTAYSALTVMPKFGDSVGILYEQSTLPDFIFTPTAIVFQIVYP